MEIQSWFDLFIEQIKDTSALQWVAVSFGVTEVLLAKKNNVLLYPAGIISSALSILLLVEVLLYAEAALSTYYVIMSIYGWAHWLRRKNEPPVKITYSTKQDWAITSTIALGGWGVLYFILKNFTDSDVPLLDAFISSTAWAGMWLLARRKIENWILLNISNLFAVPLLFYKNLPLFALLTAFLFVVACFGYFEWREKINIEAN
ncbi:MAG: nicotinamide mononucleotide transporter [Sphingobacteriaceae bacterium]|nr:nicotinamide mononucleotide transporter [Sphingobacteriaceae bacterium]